MKLVKQPKDSKLCGQACAAMLVGCSLQKAIAGIGHTHGTRTKEIIAIVLHNSDLKTSWNRLLPGPPSCNMSRYSFALCKVVPFNRIAAGPSHWILYHDREYYDPAATKPEQYLNPLYRITSHLVFVR